MGRPRKNDQDKEDSRLNILEKKRQRSQTKRAAETETESITRRQSDRLAKKRKSNVATESERQNINERSQQIMRVRRATMTPSERQESNNQASQRMSQLRSQMTQDERDESNRQAREGMSRLRSQMTQEERQQLNQVDRIRKRKERQGDSMICRGAEPIDDDDKLHYLGLMDQRCMHCNAIFFKDEKIKNKGNSFSMCCQHGSVEFDEPEYPQKLIDLFDLKEFRQKIRMYNNLHAFGSFNADTVNFGRARVGPYSFIVQGQIYYGINEATQPEPQEKASYGQLYIVDTDEAVNIRHETFNDLDKGIITTITNLLNEINVQAKSYQMLKDEIEASSSQNETEEMYLLFGLKPGSDPRRYNMRSSNEVAAVFATNADGDIPDAYVTICNKKTKKLQTINNLQPHVEPWIYPILYPHGNLGWSHEMKLKNLENRKYERLTRNAYMKYKIRITDKFNPFLMGGKLFQQWLVDNYLKLEKEKINYNMANQKKLNAEKYTYLQDVLKNAANDQKARIGRTVILPSTFIGSPRYMEQNYQDAMSIVAKTGKPDLFITITCNPRWKEIVDNLKPNQEPSDRPDLVARVFKLKLDYLIDLIENKHFFGKTKAGVFTIEFQKRGLPHAHILVTLQSEYKIRSAEIVDKYISAELPDQDLHPELFDMVKTNMLHGPCGARCIVNGKCSKKFPKEFREETTLEDDGFPKYRRRNDGKFVMKGSNKYDNRHVVPYCPKLMMLLGCHLNVEVTASVKSVKYIFKYVFKGHDRAAFKLVNDTLNYDECTAFSDSRYIGAPEAAWRTFNFRIHYKSHTIIRLPIHLDGQQSVMFPDDADNETIQTAMDSSTMLTDFFRLNREDPKARNLLYHEIPEKFTWNKKKWNERKSQFNVIGRIYSVSPTQSELFHLRILLRHVKGPRSYEELRTVNGKICQTFMAACREYGLIEDDDEWMKVMEEAKNHQMPYQMRTLFVSLLVNCQVNQPEALWEQFKEAMAEDYARKNDETTAQAKAYRDICNLLQKQGKSIKDFPNMIQSVLPDDDDEDIISPQFDPVISKSIGEQMYNNMNGKQKEIIDQLIESVECPGKNNCYYIDGPGGSGKTYTYTTLMHKLISKGKSFKSMAFTGIAAILLINGKTVHRTIGLPVPLNKDSTSQIRAQSKEAEELKKTDVFIWDEAPMAPKYALEIMNKLLQKLMNNNKLFGGKTVVLGGDFRQLLPVCEGGTRSECVSLSIKKSCLWKYFKIFKLSQNMRADANEIQFADDLLKLGEGKSNDDNEMIIVDDDNIINDDLATNIYGKYFERNEFEAAANSAILAARNVDVDEINEAVIEMLDPSTEKLYTSIDEVEDVTDPELKEQLNEDFLNNINPPSLPPHSLKLRLNTVVMLIRNINFEEGLCNGTRLLVTKLDNHMITCKILTGDKANNIVFIHRVTLTMSDKKTYGFALKRRQFPLRSAFCMTINKAQGQTFERVGIDLRNDVFNHGQLYVAMSRAKRSSAIKIYLGQQKKTKKVKNIVYQEVLQ